MARAWAECGPSVGRSTCCRCTPRGQELPTPRPRLLRSRGAERRKELYACESPLTGGWWHRVGRSARYRRAVVDDVWRDENEKVTLFVVGARFAEESADQRQGDAQRNARIGLRGLGYGHTADARGLAVANEQLGVARLLAEDESDVRRCELRVRVLGVEQQQDLTIVGDVRRNRQDDTDLLH